MSKIWLHIQSLTQVDREAFASAIHWSFWIGRHTEHTLGFSYPRRGSIDHGRNMAAKLALEAECDYLWFLDDDMPIAPHTLESLIQCDADIAMAHSFIRGYPYQPMCFKWTEGSGPENPQGSALRHFHDDGEFTSAIDPITGLVEVAAVGFTCCLIRCDLLKKLQPPFFLTTPNSTEDVTFCLKAHFEQDKKLKIVVDTKVPTAHLGEREWISQDTVKELRKYHESLREVEEAKGRQDRDVNYLKMVEELVK